MPHQCTECGRTFADGSKEMLSGCPDCGGNKFQFQPSSAQADARKAESTESDADDAASAGAGPADTAADHSDPGSAGDPVDADSDWPDTDDRARAGEDRVGRGDDTARADDDRARTDVQREMSEFARDADTAEAEADSKPAPTGADQFDEDDDAEIETTTAEEDRAQRDARSSPATNEEIDEARRKMAEAEQERLAEVDDQDDEARPTHGRGTPQGPPTEGPDEAATEQFGLDGAVGGPDEQPSADTAGPNEQPSPNNTSDPDSEAETLEGPETDLAALREELNDQFESIKITAPGQYELNLMELYDRKEYIISLQEDGRYVVDIPEGYEYRED